MLPPALIFSGPAWPCRGAARRWAARHAGHPGPPDGDHPAVPGL